MEVALINFAIAPIANLLCACADGTDKNDRWKWLLLQTLAYWARAIQFETNSKYNLVDVVNNFKSATAATAVSDSFLEGVGLFGKTFAENTVESLFYSTLGYGKNINSNAILLDTPFIATEIYKTFTGQWDPDEYDSEELIKRKAYAGHTPGFRAFMKMTPFHNGWEQAIDPFTKRSYHETQIMKMSKEERESWIYDWLHPTSED